MWNQQNVREGDEVTARDDQSGEWRVGVVDSTSEEGCQVVFQGSSEASFVAWVNVDTVWR